MGMGIDAGSVSAAVRIRLSELSGDIAACKTAIDNLGTEFKQSAEKYSTLAGQRYANSLKTIAKEMGNVEGAAKAGALTEQQAISRLITLRQTELRILQDRAVKEGTASKETVAAIKKTETALSSLNQKQALLSEKSTQGMGDFAKQVAGFTTGYGLAVQAVQAVISVIGNAAKSAITLAMGYERTQMELGVMFRSMDVGNKALKEWNALASQTPLELQDIIASGKQLASVGVPVGEITDKIRMLGDVAMGNPEKLDRLTQAFAQLRSKGVASMEQLNRFIEAGVPIMSELEKQTGKTGQEVFKMVEQGKIGYPEVEAALKSLTGAGGLMHDMMAKVAETASGKLSTALDNTKLRLREIGTDLLPSVTAAITRFNEVMDQVSMESAIKKIKSGAIQDIGEIQDTITSLQSTIKKMENDPIQKIAAFGYINGYKRDLAALEAILTKVTPLEKEREKWAASAATAAAAMAAAAAATAAAKAKAAKDYAAANIAAKLKVEADAITQAAYKTQWKAEQDFNLATALQEVSNITDDFNERQRAAAASMVYATTATSEYRKEWQRIQDMKISQGLEEQAGFLDLDALAFERYIKKQESDSKDFEKAQKQMWESIGSAALSTINSIVEAYTAMIQNQIDALTIAYEAQKELIENGGKTKEQALKDELAAALAANDAKAIDDAQKALDLFNLEKKYAKEKAQLQYQADMAAWDAKLLTAAADAAMSIIKIWSEFGGNPIIAGIMTVATAVATGAQIAALNAAKPVAPKLATGGIILPQSGGVQTIQAENGFAELSMNAGPSGQTFMNQFADRIAARIGRGGEGTIVVQSILDGKVIAESTASFIDNGQVPLRRR